MNNNPIFENYLNMSFFGVAESLVIIVSMKIRLSSDDFTILKSDDHPMNSSDDNLNFILMNRMKNGLSSDEFIQIHQKLTLQIFGLFSPPPHPKPT